MLYRHFYWCCLHRGNSGIDGTSGDSNTVRIFAGNALADKATAEFRVTDGGAVTATSGTIGSLTLASDKVTIGTSTTHGNADAKFYADNTGKFGLGDKLTFDGTNLTVSGAITATSGTFTGAVNATSLTIQQPTTPTVPSGMNVPDGERTALLTKNQNANGTPNAGEIRLQPGFFRLARDLKRTVSSNIRVLTPYEGSITPTGDTFYVISGASKAWGNNTDGDATNDGRFHSTDSGTLNEAAHALGFFTAIYDTANTQWKAVANNNLTVDFTPASTDYCIAVGTKESTDTEIATLVPTQQLASGFLLPDNTTDDINAGITIESGGITMSSGGFVRGGQTGFNTGSDGFFLGYDTNAYKFSIGDVDGERLTWDGSNLTVNGGGTFTGALSGGTISIGSSNNIFKADSNGIYLGNATFASAPFRVTPAGALTATSGTVGGFTLGATSLIAGSESTRVSLSTADGISLGDDTFADAPFSVTPAGALKSTSGTIGGFTLGSTSLLSGTGVTRISLDTSNGIHLGHNTFGSAPFRVTPAGALTATNATITGAITANSGSIADSVTIGARDDNTFASKIGWNFESGKQGWTTNGTTAYTHNSGGYVVIDSSGTDPTFFSPTGLNLDGNLSTKVLVSLRRTAGSGWHGALFYDINNGHGMEEANKHLISTDPTGGAVSSDFIVVEWDMANQSNGSSWTGSETINQIRLDFGNSAADTFEVNWVAIGERGANALQEGATIQDGKAGGWTIDGDSIFSGTKKTSDAYSDSAGDITISSSGAIRAHKFLIKADGDASFKGDISAATGTLSNSIRIGSGQSVFSADSNGIYLGNETFANAEFRVTPAGAVTATSGTIGGFTQDRPL